MRKPTRTNIPQIYTSTDTSIAPTSFLHTLWVGLTSTNTSSNLASLASPTQHDAHELFTHLLSSLHSNLRGSTSVSCVCVVHQAFGGALRSEVRCGRCGTVRPTTDGMMDLALEVENVGKGKGPENVVTLADCLRRYTRIEKLGPKEQVRCNKCAGLSEVRRYFFS